MRRMSSFGPASGPVSPPSTNAPPPTLDARRTTVKPSPKKQREPVVPWVTDGLIAPQARNGCVADSDHHLIQRPMAHGTR